MYIINRTQHSLAQKQRKNENENQNQNDFDLEICGIYNL